MSEPVNKTEDERLSTLDKINLAFGIIAIIFLAGSLALNYLPPTTVQNLSATWKWLGERQTADNLRMVGMGAMVLYVITLAMLKEKEIAQLLKHRNTHSGANILLQVAAVIGILGAINYFAARHHTRVDVTENKQYSLASQSVEVVKKIKDPVNVTLFLRKSDPHSRNLETLWREYEYHGKDKLKLDIVDVDREPTQVRLHKITQPATSMLQRGERKTTITGTTEQDLTSALVKVLQDSQKTIYFLIGHGELTYDKYDRDGLSQLKDALEKQNYKLDKLPLFSKKEVPSDAALVVIAGPSKPLADKEIEALDKYISGGGRVFVSTQAQAESNLDKLTSKYGIEVKNDLVIDPYLNPGDPSIPAVQRFPYHKITENMQVAFFPVTRSLAKAKEQPKDVTNVQALVETTEQAWGETDLNNRQLKFDQGQDNKGPLPIMMLAEKGKGRLIVSGNTLFFANESFPRYNNGDLFMSALNWMADEESLVSVPPKDPANRSVDLKPWQYPVLFFGTVAGFPLALLLMGGWVWWRRR